MLKGLEVSEVRFSEVLKADDSFRTDAEFFSKKDLIIIEQLQRLNFRKLKDVVNKIDVGFVGTMKNHYTESQNDPILLQTKNINEFTVGLDDVLHIDSDFHHELNKSQIHKGNVLIARSGSFGKASIWLEDYVVNSSDIIIVECSKEINPYYVVAFLNSEFGKTQLFRFASGGLQGHVNLTILENLIIPLLSSDFQSQIASLVKSAHTKLVESKSLYAQAEDTLLCELGLKDWQPKNEAVSIKTFSDFASSGRLDAEFYQSKYDELFEKLSKFPQLKIKDIINYPVSSGSTPKAGDSEYYSDEKTGIPFLRAVDIIQSRIDLNDLMYIKSRVHNGLLKRTQLHKGDVLFSIAGTVGRCGIFDYDFEANINQAIAILRFDESVVKHLYVVQFFNSKVGQLVIEKYARQGLQTNLNLEELSDLPIPILPQETQKQIAELIQTSFALRQESKQLLESAKRMVEEEIEK